MVELNRKYLAEKLGENELIESTCIDLSNNQISKINSNTFKKLSNLKELSLRNNEITDIYSKAFESLSSLKMLFLFGNKLNRLETKTFKGLNQLQILELNRNQISEIDLKFFECLANLRELFMDKNKLKRIDSSTFKGLSRLRVLSLNDNEIVDIESNAFECLSSLRELYLVGNALNRIDSNTFKGLGKLEILYVSRVVKIDGNSFRDNLSNLRELNLSDNSLKRIDSNSFNGLDKLEKLNLSDNDLDELDSNLFKSNSNLKCLYINNNKLKRIDTDLFKGLVKLEEILLSFNQIEFIHVGLFEGLCNLKVLWLNDNKLNEFNRKCFEPLKSIHLIQLYNNQVKALSYFSRSTQLVSWLYDKASLNKNGYLIDWSTFLEHFDESREFQNHPEVIIFDYYDDLIRDIDIYTEEQIEKYSQDDLLPIESNREYQNSVEIEGFKDPYKTEYKNDLTINVTPGSTKIIDYLNQVRFKAIEEIDKTRKENLSRYEIEKAKYKSDIKVEEIKRELFKEKFCFLLRIRNTNKSNRFNPKFELITVVTDFYLEHSERHLIKCLILNYLTFPFKNCLESHLISNYIIGKLRFYGNEVISITKETLQKIESISVIGSDLYGKIDFNFSLTHDFVDLSQLKSIDVHYQKLNDTNKLENLNCVQNLEYLSISNGIIKQEAFTGLDKLIRLKLENCDVYNNSLHSEMFSHLKSIENLEMSNFPKNLDVDKFNLDWLKPLVNLKKLSVQISKRYLIRCLDFLQFESLSKLEYLTLNESKIKDLVPGAFSKLKHLKYLEVNRSFYFRPDLFLGLDNLETLVIKRNEVNQNKIKLVEGVFNGLSNLKTLDLSLNNLKNIDPEVFINIPMLTHLKIVGTKLNLDENAFSHLKHLKTIEIDKSDLKHFDSNILEALRRSNIEIIIH